MSLLRRRPASRRRVVGVRNLHSAANATTGKGRIGNVDPTVELAVHILNEIGVRDVDQPRNEKLRNSTLHTVENYVLRGLPVQTTRCRRLFMRLALRTPFLYGTSYVLELSCGASRSPYRARRQL